MARSLKVLIVLAVFAPVVVASGLPSLTAGLRGVSFDSVPLTMLLLLIWFLAFVLLVWIFAQQDEDPEGGRP